MEATCCPCCNAAIEPPLKLARTACPTCQGSGRLTRWHYHLQCYRDSDNRFHIFRNEPVLRVLMENALKQRDYRFEELPPHIEPTDLRVNGLLYFDSYLAPCPDCLGTGKMHAE